MTRRAAAMLLACALGIASCAGSDEGGSAAALDSGSTEASALPEGQFANPVLDRDFPDPGVIEVDGTYYAYATGGGGAYIQLARSTDLVTWEYLREALDSLPIWSSGDTWAPEVIETSAGYVMYYTARHPATERPDGQGSQCITIASADAPEGPFVDDSDAPFICQADLGGSIDATPVYDEDGTLYLVWKNDGNCCGMLTRFWAQELSEDGLTLVGEPVDLGVVNDTSWERHVIEAPTLVRRDGTWYLFFSANDFGSDLYAVGYATSDALLGPFTDADENPILATPEEGGPFGPGHQSIVTGPDGEPWIVYHAWDSTFSQRSMWIDQLRWEDGRPVIDGPDSEPQEAP